jgi:hypothetical protein
MLVLGRNANYGLEGYKDNDRFEVTLSAEARKQGMYVIGTTGTGKSTLLLKLALQDMETKGPKGYEGLCVLDPHGDLITDILRRVPRARWDHVVLFDPTKEEYPCGLNLLECNKKSAKERDYVTSGLLDILYKLFGYSWGPRMEDLLRVSILSLLHHPEPTTLIHLMLVLANREHRQRLTAEAKKVDPIIRAYWEDQFPESVYNHKTRQWRKPQEQREMVGPALNKIDRFIVNRSLRHIIGQEYSTFNIRKIMDEGKILLVNLSKGDLGPDNSSLLGAVLVNQLLIAALSRKEKPKEERRPFHLYVDEYQTFATKTFPQLQSEARKYAIDTVVAHQYRDQLDLENKGSSLNVANLVVLRVSGTDATELAVQYDLTPQPPLARFESRKVPYDEQGDIWVEEVTPGTGAKLYHLTPGPQQLYSDVQLETANLLAQLDNFEAIARVLENNRLKQFRIALKEELKVDDDDRAKETEAYIRAQSRQVCRHHWTEVAARIAEYSAAPTDLDGYIPAEDIE